MDSKRKEVIQMAMTPKPQKKAKPHRRFKTKFNPTDEQMQELEGLYFKVMIANKYPKDEAVQRDFRKSRKYIAERLDELKVPWAVQNLVAGAAERRENWSNYNKTVIRKVIADFNK